MKHHDVAILILAAGESKRMGKPKQQLKFNETTLLEHSVDSSLHSMAGNVLVVLGSNHLQHLQILEGKSIKIVYHADWQKGIGSSIKIGVRNILEENINIQAILILVCDQPLLSTVILNDLIETYKEKLPMAVASSYNDTFGVPAIFDRSLFNDLLKISNDSGAKEVLNKFKNKLLSIPFSGGEIDLDTPKDYKNFIYHNSKL